MKRIPMKGAAEWDGLTKARHLYCYTRKAGVKKSIRKGYKKRLRKAQKAEVKTLLVDC